MIDGRTVYTPLLAGTYWEVQDTLLEDIDRIEVIRGPGGTIWGPNAVNGVINIITKSTRETKGTYASAGGGNVDQGFLNFRYGGGGDNLTWRAYGKAFTRGPEYHADGDNFDDWRGVQGGFRMDWGRGRDSFTLQGDIYTQEDGEQVAYSNYVPPVQENVDGYAYASGENINFRWKRTFSEGNDLQIQGYWDRTARHEPNIGEIRDSGDVDVLARTRLGRHELSYGIEARVSPNHFLETGSGLVFFPRRRTDYLLTTFLEDDIDLIPKKLNLIAGSKVLRTNYTGYDFEPSVRLMWTPNDKHAVWAAFTHALRTPSDAEEDFYLSSYLGTGGNGLPFFARFNVNPVFATEQLNAYESGYRQFLRKNLFLDLTLFYNRYHNLFSEDAFLPPVIENGLPFPEPVPPGPHNLIIAQWRNDLFGSTKGAEIAPEWRPSERMRFRGSWSFLDMNLNAIPGTLLFLTPAMVDKSSPRHEVTVESSFDISKKLALDFTYRYVSAAPQVLAAAYSTGDARIAWQFSRHVAFSLVGRNLFQPWHVEYVGDPEPVGVIRSGYASLEWR